MYKQFGTGEFVEVANDCIDIFCQRFKELEGYYKNNSDRPNEEVGYEVVYVR